MPPVPASRSLSRVPHRRRTSLAVARATSPLPYPDVAPPEPAAARQPALAAVPAPAPNAVPSVPSTPAPARRAARAATAAVVAVAPSPAPATRARPEATPAAPPAAARLRAAPPRAGTPRAPAPAAAPVPLPAPVATQQPPPAPLATQQPSPAAAPPGRARPEPLPPLPPNAAVPEIRTSVAGLLGHARHGLADATSARTPGERYAAAHLAALRAAAAVIAARATPTPGTGRRGRPVTAWVLLASVAPELGEWAAFFAAGAPKRANAEAGLPGAVTAREANDLLRDAETFLAVVETKLGGAARPSLLDRGVG